MLIVQISDTHIVKHGQKTLGVAPMAENLETVVDHINRLVPPPDIVVLTGDVTDGGQADQVQNAVDILMKLNFPLFIIPGNHDDRETLLSAFSGSAIPSTSDGFLSYTIDEYDLRLIGLDTKQTNAPGGQLCAKRLAWLEGQLALEPQKPTLIFMHHPPIKCGVLETDQDGFIGAKQLGDIVGRYANIERILCGHIHLSTHARWHGTAISTCPSIGMRLGLDLTMQNDSVFFLHPPEYLLHHWTDNGALITHTIKTSAEIGPFSFDGDNSQG